MVFPWLAQVGAGFGNEFTTDLSISGVPVTDGFTLDFNDATNLLSIEFSNFATFAAGNYTIDVEVSLGNETNSVAVPLEILPVPGLATLQLPINGTTTTDDGATFSWAMATNVDSYTFQMANDEAFTDIILNQVTTETSLTLDGLSFTGLVYWRVVSNNECGNATPSPFSITFDPSGVYEFSAGRSLAVFPNPATREVFLRMDGNWSGALAVRLLSVQGQVLQNHQLPAGGLQALNLNQLPAGTYLLEMRNGSERAVERLVVLK